MARKPVDAPVIEFGPVVRDGSFKFYDVQGREREWKQLRLGIPTASNFHKILTPKTLELAKSHVTYMDQLLAEWITGEEIEGYESEWMQRGTDLEDQAIRGYEGVMDRETSNGGFFTLASGLAGCSPDRLVGSAGGAEIKCRLLHTQIGHALRGMVSDEAKAQVQGCLWITERDWWDVFSYHPSLIIPAVRVYRDEMFIAALKNAMAYFTDKMLEARLKLESEYGPFVRPDPEPAPPDALGLTEEDADRILEAYRGNRL